MGYDAASRRRPADDPSVRRLGLAQLCRRARSKDVDGGSWGDARRVPGEPRTGCVQRRTPRPMERAGVQRSPVDRHRGAGTQGRQHLGAGARTEVPRSKVRPPAPDRKQCQVDRADPARHPGIRSGVAREVGPRRGIDHEADRLGARATGRDPVTSWNGPDPDAIEVQPFPGSDLEDDARRGPGHVLAESPRDDDGGATG